MFKLISRLVMQDISTNENKIKPLKIWHIWDSEMTVIYGKWIHVEISWKLIFAVRLIILFKIGKYKDCNSRKCSLTCLQLHSFLLTLTTCNPFKSYSTFRKGNLPPSSGSKYKRSNKPHLGRKVQQIRVHGVVCHKTEVHNHCYQNIKFCIII
jgi:hypothetical protein